jgi:hypothetical protein
MTGHSVAFSVSLVRLGKRGETEVDKARREEGFVRPRKGQDGTNFARDESLSIITRIEEGRKSSGRGRRERVGRMQVYIRDNVVLIVRIGISNILIGWPV